MPCSKRIASQPCRQGHRVANHRPKWHSSASQTPTLSSKIHFLIFFFQGAIWKMFLVTYQLMNFPSFRMYLPVCMRNLGASMQVENTSDRK